MPERDDLHAALEARKELGPDYEPQVVDSFLERIERRLSEHRPPMPAKRSERRGESFVLAIVSMVMAIPITAIAATHGGIAAMVVVWLGIVLVNLVYGLKR
jgi:hypothetical protein